MIKNKWALFGVTFFYLLEQMYSASFSAFPHCCPSVSRPILFTGKQQKMYLFTWLLTSLYSCVVFLTYKYKGACVTRHAGSLRRARARGRRCQGAGLAPGPTLPRPVASVMLPFLCGPLSSPTTVETRPCGTVLRITGDDDSINWPSWRSSGRDFLRSVYRARGALTLVGEWPALSGKVVRVNLARLEWKGGEGRFPKSLPMGTPSTTNAGGSG